MQQPLILVSSITYAMKGKRILEQRGIRAYVERIPRTRETGCGYGIYVPGETDEAERQLRNMGINILGRSERKNVYGL